MVRNRKETFLLKTLGTRFAFYTFLEAFSLFINIRLPQVYKNSCFNWRRRKFRVTMLWFPGTTMLSKFMPYLRPHVYFTQGSFHLLDFINRGCHKIHSGLTAKN